MDIAGVAMGMKAMETSYQMSVATMKGAMESTEAIAAALMEQMMNLNVGTVAPGALDMYI